ncbi:MAG: CPBP family intramembrane metalloprotease [Pyrinomonadaceae bacterium]|nr:CPBP family intramembrane metalloprotease [Pyrinomonadaceae bacterium]
MQSTEQIDFYDNLPLPEAEVPSHPTPNDPPWGSPAALGAWFISVMLILLLPSLFLLPYLMTLDPPMVDTKAIVEFAQSDKIAVFLQVSAIIPAHLLTLLLAWMIVTAGRRYSFTEMLGWQSGGVNWRHYVGILVGFLAIAAVVSYFAPEQENDLMRILRSSKATVYLVVFMATFTAPIVEEVIYRGLLYSSIQRALGVPAAFAIVTLLFSIVHVPQYYPSYSTIFLLTLLSVCLTALRVWSKNLWPCIVLHMLFNGLQSVMIVLDPEAVSPLPTEQIPALFGVFN